MCVCVHVAHLRLKGINPNAVPELQVGLLLATGSVVGMGGGPVGGWLADRYGRRAVLIPAMATAAGSTAGLMMVRCV